MPTISVPQALLQDLMKQLWYEHNIEQVNDELPLLGTDIDACNEEQLDIEIFPDRPDLLSGETLAYAMVNFLHGAPATPDLNVKPSGLTMTVDEELSGIRPVIYGAVVRGVDVPEDAAGNEQFSRGHGPPRKTPLRTRTRTPKGIDWRSRLGEPCAPLSRQGRPTFTFIHSTRQ